MKPTLPITRFANTVFCEDIRQETGGKLSLMGVYHGVLFTTASKLILPKLCAMITVRAAADDPLRELTFRLLKDDEVLATHRVEIDGPPKVPDGFEEQAAEDRTQQSITIMQLVPFEATKNCVVRVRVETESEVLKGGGLAVRIGVPQQ